MTKRIISLLLVTVMLFSFSICSYANGIDNILEKEGITGEAEVLLTRADLAEIIAGLAGFRGAAACDTKFKDVTAENEKSGYIAYCVDYGFMKPETATDFAPDRIITGKDVLSAVISVSSADYLWEVVKNTAEPYTALVTKYKMLPTNVSLSDSLTREKAYDIIAKIVSAKIPKLEYTGQGFEITGQTSMLSMLNIDVVEAMITMVDYPRAVFNVKENLYETNAYSEGEEISAQYLESVDINYLEMCPAEIWIHEETIVFAQKAKRVDVTYEYIYSVNENPANVEYATKYINTIRTYGDEKYDLTSDTQIRCNFDIKNWSDTVSLTGMYAKLVHINGDLVSIDAWTLGEAAVLIEADRAGALKCASLSNGIKGFNKVRNINDYERSIIISDGKSITFREIPNDCLVSCFVTSDKKTIVIVCSEKKIVDRFGGIGEDTVIIGNGEYSCDISTLCVSLFDNIYKVYDSEMMRFISTSTVTAYVDNKGYVRFIAVRSDEKNSFFIGIVSGMEKKRLSDIHTYKILKLDGSNETVILDESKKVKYGSGVNVSSIESNCGVYGIDNVFWFRTNAKNQIISIDAHKPYLELQNWQITRSNGDLPNTSVPLLDNSADPAVNIKVGFGQAKFLYLHYDGDDFSTIERNWAALRAMHVLEPITFNLIQDETGGCDPIVILTGAQTAVGGYGHFGIVTNKRVMVGADEDKYIVKLLRAQANTGLSSGEIEVSEEIFNALKIDCQYDFSEYIFYKDNTERYNFGEKTPSIEFSSTPGNLSGTSCFNGVIEEITRNYIKFTDGTLYFINNEYQSPCIYIGDEGNKYSTGSIEDLYVGQSVSCWIIGYAIGAIYYE